MNRKILILILALEIRGVSTSELFLREIKMKILYLTGIIGSGKTTLEANLRRQTWAVEKNDLEVALSENNEIAFIGRTSAKRGDKKIKFAGLDAYKGTQDELLDKIRNLGESGVKYAVLSGLRNFKPYAPKFESYGLDFEIFFNKRTTGRVVKQRMRRREEQNMETIWTEKAKVERQQTWQANEIERWRNLQEAYKNIKITILKGPTKQRISRLLESVGRSYDHSKRIVRKAYS